MSWEALQELVGRAIIDKDFEHKLLHSPRDALKAMNLSPEEVKAVLSIRADSLSQFAGKLHKMFYTGTQIKIY